MNWDLQQEPPTSYQAEDPSYLTAVDGLQRELRRLEQISSSARRALEGLGTARESSRTRAEVAGLIGEGKELIKGATKTVRDIGAMKASRAERTHRQMEVQKLTKDLQDRVTAFQKVRAL